MQQQQQQQQQPYPCPAGESQGLGLPAEWEMRRDPSTGRYYYLNHARHTTAWSLPAEVVAAIRVPVRWEARTDPRTNRLYFIDHVNRTTSWQNPAALMQPQPQPQPPLHGPYPPVGAAPIAGSPYPPTMMMQRPTPVAAPGAFPPQRAGPQLPQFAHPVIDPRVAEMAALGFSEQAARDAAAAWPEASVSQLVENTLAKKMTGVHVPVPAGRVSPGAPEKERTPPSQGGGSGSPGAARQEYEKAPAEDNTCTVCMERRIDVVLLKCGHMCVCGVCATSLKTCPICRGPIQEIVRVFRA